jgi:ferric-dicitrate binding protein FerR (iron transport regulator)
MMNDDRLWSLLARQLADEASPAEKEELQRLLAERPDKQYLADIISTFFSAPPAEAAPEAGPDLNQRLQRILKAGEGGRPYHSGPAPSPVAGYPAGKRPFRSLKRLLPYAAVLAGIGLSFWLVRRPANPVVLAEKMPVHSSEVVARPGARTRLVLPDSTQVWLNSGSSLHYKNDFNSSLREVTLEGEAFFDVTKDPGHPFIVHTSAINVKVLGTAFNIKSYPRDEVIETTLLRGLIEVTRQDDPSAPKVILRPNEKLVLNKHSAVSPAPHTGAPPEQISNISITPLPRDVPDSDKAETSWMYNKLVFDGDGFGELAAKMERWYNVKIVFRSDRLLKYRFKGVFSNETVAQALDALRLTTAFRYQIKENEIDLYE